MIILLGFGLRMFNLGHRNYYGDEPQVIRTAAGRLYSDTYEQWCFYNKRMTGNHYDRAWPHTWAIAQTYKVFGISEWSSRLVSVLFGTLMLVVAYPLAKELFNCKDTALLFTALLAFHHWFIELSRFVRMYILYITVYMFGSLLIYRGMTRRGHSSMRIRMWDRTLSVSSRSVDLAVGAIVMYLSFILHITTIIFCVSFCLFTAYLALRGRSTTYSIVLIVVLSASLALLFSLPAGTSFDYKTIISYPEPFIVRAEPHYGYYITLFKFPSPFSKEVSTALILMMIVGYLRDHSRDRRPLVFTLSIILPAAIFFIFFSNRYMSFLYIANIVPFSYLLVTHGFVSIVRSITQSRFRYLILFMPVALIAQDLSTKVSPLYYDGHLHPNYRDAYKTLLEEYRPGQALFGQYTALDYLSDYNGTMGTVSMIHHQRYPFSQFKEDLSKYDSGWVTWATYKPYHLEPEIIEYCESNFKKLHGAGIDNTKVELYFFNRTMVR